MDYVLQFSLTESDIEFLNETSVKFKVFNSIELNPSHDPDGGWRDIATGARIVHKDDRVAFLNVTPEELTLLTLKFYNRLKPLHNGFKKIYKYDPNIR